jgi:alkylhydroperoxidase family enzyme
VGRADGITEAEWAALPDAAGSPLFNGAERAALAYAEAITNSHTVADELFEELRRHFSDDAIVVLTAAITFEICAAKFNRALEIEAQGVCPVARL